MSGRRLARRPPGASAFTLIEVLISLAIGLAIAVFAVITYERTWHLVERSEQRMTMHANAQTIYDTLHRSLSGLEQHCALVLESTATGAGPPGASGAVTLIFMHGKENLEDWKWYNQTVYCNSDLVWEKWSWSQASGLLMAGSSSSHRAFQVARAFKPGGVDLTGTTFYYLPQPRRTLDPSAPEETLNDDMLFPSDPAHPLASAAGAGDWGDDQDLNANLSTVIGHVSSLTFQIEQADGAIITVDDLTTQTVVRNGVWMDGRLAPALASQSSFTGSDLARRPRLLRMMYTVTDPPSGLEQTFSFSFALPGLSPDS